MFNAGLHLALTAAIWTGGLLLNLLPQWILALTPRCGLKLLTGWNCPFCGMTRDFAALASGNPAAHNPASPALAVLLFAIYPVTVIACLGLRRNLPLTPDMFGRIVPPVLLAMFVMNNWRI